MMRTRALLMGPALLLAILAVAVAAAGCAGEEKPSRMVTVPLLTQTDVIRAYDLLRAAGLRVAIRNRFSVEALCVPIAREQSPRQGTRTAVGSVVTISAGFCPSGSAAVAKRMPTATVPAFDGDSASNALSLAVALILIAPSAVASSTKVHGPFLLASLPALGTITWSCDPARRPGLGPNLPGLALGFRSFRATATEHLRLNVGKRTLLRRVVQPGESVQFPYLRSRMLDVVQSTGAGTLRGFVTANFVPHGPTTYCYRYLPPRIEVRVEPRR